MDGTPMIWARGLEKRYGTTQALAGVDLEVARGSILSLLGPNGAGKTTALRILTTLALPDAGEARVAGFDVRTEARHVRRQIGVAAQDATLDELLTGRQNLVMAGRLSGLPAPAARRRAAELLELFELTAAGDRPVKGYSGGMRRRLDLGASMVTNPPVLFLDEPTTGLDPNSRQRVWEVIRQLVASGVTVLLTTQYLEEADQLAEQVVVVDHGRVIASGTPVELKRSVGGARVEVTLAEPDEAAAAALTPHVDGPVLVAADGRHLSAPVRSDRRGIGTTLVRALDAAGIAVDDLEIRPPSLDDVFFTLTGHSAAADDPAAPHSDEPEELLA